MRSGLRPSASARAAFAPGPLACAGLLLCVGLGDAGREAARTLRKPSSAAGQFQFGGFQALDLVTQTRRLLELQAGGGAAHALLELRDVGLEVVTHQFAATGVAGVPGDVVALVDRPQDVGDLLADGLRRDASRRKPSA